MWTPSRIVLLLISLAGAAFCLLNAAGAELLCLTEGCRVYADYRLFGISFYVFGAAWFLTVLLLALVPDRRRPVLLFTAVLVLGLALDALFLAWQALFLPCSSCLAVALLMGLAALAALPLLALAYRRLLLGTGAVWLILFTAVGLALAKEVVLRPWPIYGDPEAKVKIYFSADCQACQKTVRQLIYDYPETAARSAFFPVLKGETDRRRISSFLDGGGADTLEDLLLLFDDPAGISPSLPPLTRIRLLANKAALLRAGATTVPLVIAPDLPRTALPPQLDLFPPAGSLFDSDNCPAFEETKCD